VARVTVNADGADLLPNMASEAADAGGVELPGDVQRERSPRLVFVCVRLERLISARTSLASPLQSDRYR
jgi:hypothetical protein